MLTYNRETLVSRAIESILAQTYSDFEFIIIDNGSTDHSGETADTYAEKDRRIRVIHRERGSISAGRNTAIDAARGEYIAFIDDDDWVEPDFLIFLLNLLLENDSDVSICGTSDKAFPNVKMVMTPEEAVIELLRRKKYNTGFPTKLFRREIINSIRFPECAAYDDIAVMYRLLSISKWISYHGSPKYNICRHSGNQSSWTTNHQLISPDILDEYLQAYRTRTEWLCKKFPQKVKTLRYYELSFMISMVEKIQRLQISACQHQLAYMKTELAANKETFLSSPETLDFEKEWIDKYIN